MEPTALNSLHHWLDLIVNTKAAYIDQTNSQINILGDGDEAYLLINQYTGDHASTEYYFKPEGGSNGLMSLLSLLDHFDFSVDKLLAALPSLNYVEEPMGQVATFPGIRIYRDHVTSN